MVEISVERFERLIKSEALIDVALCYARTAQYPTITEVVYILEAYRDKDITEVEE